MIEAFVCRAATLWCSHYEPDFQQERFYNVFERLLVFVDCRGKCLYSRRATLVVF